MILNKLILIYGPYILNKYYIKLFKVLFIKVNYWILNTEYYSLNNKYLIVII